MLARNHLLIYLQSIYCVTELAIPIFFRLHIQLSYFVERKDMQSLEILSIEKPIQTTLLKSGINDIRVYNVNIFRKLICYRSPFKS
jgi:hypothetical protein